MEVTKQEENVENKELPVNNEKHKVTESAKTCCGYAAIKDKWNTVELQKLQETYKNAWLSYTITLLFWWLFPFQLDFYGVVSCNPSVGQQKSENWI